jgi:hypothetical protein
MSSRIPELCMSVWDEIAENAAPRPAMIVCSFGDKNWPHHTQANLPATQSSILRRLRTLHVAENERWESSPPRVEREEDPRGTHYGSIMD